MLVDIGEFRLESINESKNKEELRSVLGLPELTNDISVSDSEKSPNALMRLALEVGNGDLVFCIHDG